MSHPFEKFFCGKKDESSLEPLLIVTNTNPILNEDDKYINYIFFLSKKNIKQLSFYYFYFSLNDANTSERYKDKFDIATVNQLNEIFASIKLFINSLKDNEINIYSFSECKMSHETSQDLLDKMIKRQIL